MYKKNIFVVCVAFIFAFVAVEIGLRGFYKPPSKTYPCNEQGHPAYTVKQCPTSQDRLSTMRFSGDLLYTPERNRKIVKTGNLYA